MVNLLIFTFQFLASIAAFLLISLTFFNGIENKGQIIRIILAIHLFRYVPLALFLPGQADPMLSGSLKMMIVTGDLFAAIMAFIALLRLNSKHSAALLWAFSIVSALDLLTVFIIAMINGVYSMSLNANYFVVVFYVPLLLVSQALLFKILFQTQFKKNI